MPVPDEQAPYPAWGSRARARAASSRLRGVAPPAPLVHGKGRRQRLAYLGMNGAAEAMAAWLAIRGEDAKRAAMSTAKASRAAKQSFKNR